MLLSTALVFLMTPGLALFYGGMVRGKNVLSVLMHLMTRGLHASAEDEENGLDITEHGENAGALSFAGVD